MSYARRALRGIGRIRKDGQVWGNMLARVIADAEGVPFATAQAHVQEVFDLPCLAQFAGSGRAVGTVLRLALGLCRQRRSRLTQSVLKIMMQWRRGLVSTTTCLLRASRRPGTEHATQPTHHHYSLHNPNNGMEPVVRSTPDAKQSNAPRLFIFPLLP